MRTLLMLAALIPASAIAAELPISGVFGSRAACAIYAAGGADAVFHDGMKDDGTMVADIPADDAPIILVTPSTLVSVETTCKVAAVAGERVDYACDSDGGALTISATVEERGGTLAYDANGEPLILNPCR